ncbi:MAG TPA: hypothetical protein VM709_13920, partial [Candidatus Sulfotelmatobacter sp.]|nr:hypothetical protein [Candidatus Sulfotelmatobacter sp.]
MRLCRILFLAFLFFSGSLISQAATNHPKILLIYDMEGVSGVSHYEMTWVERPEDYARGREFLTS